MYKNNKYRERQFPEEAAGNLPAAKFSDRNRRSINAVTLY